MRFCKFLIIALVTILPLFPYQLDTRIIYAIALLSLSLYKIFIKNFTEDLQNKNPITIFFLLFLTSSVISTIFSINREQSLFTLLAFISYFVIFTSIRTLFPTYKSQLSIAYCLLPIAFLLSAISLYHTLFLHYVNRTPEGASFWWSYFGHNHLSALLIFAIPLSIALVKIRPFKPLHPIAYCLLPIAFLFSLFFTFSVGSILSLLLAGVITLMLAARRLSPRQSILTIFSILIPIFSIFWLLSVNREFGLKKDLTKSLGGRIDYWQDAVSHFKEKPLTGTGLDTFRFTQWTDPKKSKVVKSYVLSFPLQMLTDAGILGFLSSIGLVAFVIWQGLKKVQNSKFNIQYSIFIALLASSINALVDFDWQIPMVFVTFWIFSGILSHAEH